MSKADKCLGHIEKGNEVLGNGVFLIAKYNEISRSHEIFFSELSEFQKHINSISKSLPQCQDRSPNAPCPFGKCTWDPGRPGYEHLHSADRIAYRFVNSLGRSLAEN